MKIYPQSGYTLMELMITLSIAGIVLGLAVPGMNQFIKNERLTTTTNMLLTDLMLARSEAVERNLPAFVCASSDQATCTNGSFAQGWLVYVDADDDGAPAAGEIVKIQQAINDISFSTTDTIGASIRFDRRGFSPTANGNISICDSRGNDYAKTLAISKTGRVSRGATPSCA
jgi:type IV fimbrial biogenesis protein FimT